jgi:broad specificity phosphatase PhoE
MTAIYVLRHPQTTWNAEQRYQGRLESPVSAEGRMQSRLAARAFAGSPLVAVYSSPLARSLYLARELAQGADSPLIIDQRLTEIAQTPWEGLSLHEIRQRYADLHDQWYARPDLVHFSGGESLADVQLRALSVLADIYAVRPNSNVAVVTHAVVIQALAAAALSLDLRYIHRIAAHNAGTTTFCGISAPGSLLSLNSTAALYHSPVASAVAQACVS